MFERLGRLVGAHPWRVITVWVVAVALIVPLSPSLAEVSNSDQASFLPDAAESAQAQALAERTFPAASGATALFVVEREDGGKLTTADHRRIDQLARDLEAARIQGVTTVLGGPEQVAPDGRIQLVQVAFQGTATDQPVKDAVAELREQAAGALEGSELQAGLTGEAAIQVDSAEAFGAAEQVTLLATLALIIVLVGLIFRSPVAALLPIATIGLVFVLSTSLVALAAETFGFQVDQSLTSLLTVVLFGIGTDYILFLLFRYRERLRAGDHSRQAVAFSVRRVGEAIASSALVVIAAFLAMLFADLGFLRAMAPGLAISVAVMLAASLTLIPAVMTLVGQRVFWPSRRWQRAPEARFFKGLGRLIARRPGRMALASGGLLVALAAGAGSYTASYDTSLPSGTESAQAYETMKTSFGPGALNPTHLFVSDPGGIDQTKLGTLTRQLQDLDGVAAVAKPTLNEDATVARISVVLADKPDSNQAMATVAGPLRDLAHASGAGEQILVGGATSANVDLRATVNRDMTVVFPIAAVIIALILGLLLRSVVAPAYLLGAVALGFAATLGAGVAIFQGMAGESGLLFILPIMLYLFVIAIGTDYNILVTSRLREEVDQGNQPRTAADLAVEHAGPTVTAAGVILAGTFASLSLTGVGLLVQMGATIAIGVLLVSIVMASVFVPSLSALLGRRAWWPGHRDATATPDDETQPHRPQPVPAHEPATLR
jgi:putative drug exporter of the RND superfamily